MLLSEAPHHASPAPAAGADLVLAVPFLFALGLYGSGVFIQWRQGRPWPVRRSAAWVGGLLAAASGFMGPLASAAHREFVGHTWAHVLVGMLAPLLLVLAAPGTLALRSLHVSQARRLSRIATSWPFRIVGTPVVAAVLSVGAMWALYMTPLYTAVQQDPLLHLFVMLHFLVAGYVFTAALVPVDPAPHRASYPVRATVLVLALAAHGILAKQIYASPPDGVGRADGQTGGIVMFYAGDFVDAAIIALLCARWYWDSGRNLRRARGLREATTAA